MSTNTAHTVHPDAHPTRSPATGRRSVDAGRLLPLVLEVNAATSLAAGAVGLVAARWSADRLGLDDTGWVRLVGAGLILFALAVAASSRLRGPALARAARLISGADAAWVAATVAVVAAGVLSTGGVVIAVVMGVGVLDLGLAQLWLASRLARTAGSR
ncbi:MAG: hypothetical protein R2761_26750 [Acidimicrobiales bacterium]